MDDQLRQFLIDLPRRMEYENPAAIRHNLYKALYYTCSDLGRLLPQLFRHYTTEDDIHDLHFSITTVVETRNYFDKQPSDVVEYRHPANKACARPLLPNEPVFRCRQCGFDDTCVLCVNCYNKQDHVDHDVTVYTSSGNGGLCDCGDPEAFPELNCMCKFTPLPMGSASSAHVALTMRICLDYVLDVTNFSIATLPLVHDYINKPTSMLNTQQLSNYSSLPSGRYGGGIDDNSDDLWYLILWNDEYHNYPEAMMSITKVTNVNEAKAQEIADHINKYGKAVLKEAKVYKDLLKYQKLSEAAGLVCSISSARDFMREEIVISIFNWLNDVCNFEASPEFREVCRTTLAELLLEPGFKFSKAFPAEFLMNISNNDKHKCFENGLLFDNNILNLGLCDVKSTIATRDLQGPVETILQPNKLLDNIQYSRLQYILIFQTRFSKILRKMLSDLLIVPVISDTKLKAIFTDQIAAIYPSLFTSHALADREEDLNLLRDITSQVFTCPHSVKTILENDQFKNIIGPVIDIIENNSASWNNSTGYPNFVQIDVVSERRQAFGAIMKTIEIGIRDVAYFTDKSFAGRSMTLLLNKNNLYMMLLLLRIFQGHSPIERKYGDHVERDYSEFLTLLSYSFPILKITKSLGTVDADRESVQNAVSIIMDFLFLRKVDQTTPGVAIFQVTRDPVAFINPINSLLSFILQSNDFSYFESILKNLKQPFMNISDISLRSIVLGSQVRVGCWIRNGVSVSRQAAIYFDRVLNDLTYFRDIHLNQVALIVDDPHSTLYNFLDRWELLDWFLGNSTFDKTIYEERFFSIAERFIVFLYQILTDRFFFKNTTREECLKDKARKEIAYSLCDGPKAYSKLKNCVNSETSMLEDFDNILNEVATFTAPSGLLDSGTYRLKPEVLENLDPLSLYLDASEFLTVHEALVKCLAETSGLSEDKVVLKSHIIECQNTFVNENIGRFAKTKDFAKLIYKFLQIAIDSKDETYLPQLLHLIDAVLLDDELIHGKDYLNVHFVSIPICDLLLTIVESTLSKHVVARADYLVEQFISKDKKIVESLVDCFGEDYVNVYKKRKTGLFETEADRKKRKAHERKARVLQKFAKQRETFLAQNKEYEDESESGNIEDVEGNVNSYSKATCVLCGETEVSGNPIGILVSATTNSTFWKLPESTKNLVHNAFRPWNSEMSRTDASLGGYNYNDKNYREATIEKLALSTCGHYIHYSCYKDSTGNHRQYPCPLCHNLHDFFLPTYEPPSCGGGLSENDLNGDPINLKYNSIINSSSEFKSDLLVSSLLSEEFSNLKDSELKLYCKILNEELLRLTHNTRYLPGINENEKYFNYLTNISVIIANTIRMHEIASRYEGEKGIPNLLNQIPASTKTLLRSLIQSRAILFKFRSSKKLLASTNTLKNEIESFWNSDKLIDGIFAETVLLYFQTDESFVTLCNLGLVKLISTCVYSLVLRSQEVPETLLLINKADHYKDIDPSALQCLQLIIDFVSANMDLTFKKVDTRFTHWLYMSVADIAFVYLRQMIIFKDLLTAKDDGDNSYTTTDILNELPSKLEFQKWAGLLNPLTNALHIGNFDDFIQKVSLNSEMQTLEQTWFEVIICAKIPKYMSSGILELDYPGVVRLISLPDDYKTCLTDLEIGTLNTSYENLICLHCGKKTKGKRRFGGREPLHPQHMQFCSKRTGIFYHPIENILKICIFISQNPVVHEIPGPYLTVHGETKKSSRPGKATLNKFRYDSLNKLWLNQGLYGLVTRSKFGTWRTGLGGLGLDEDIGVTRVTLDDDLNFDTSDEDMEDIDAFF